MQDYLYTPPFDVLSSSEREQLAKHSSIVYLDANHAVPKAWQGDFFVILKGKIKEAIGDELMAGLSRGDWFDTRHAATFTPSEQTLLLRINGEMLLEIGKQNTTLQKLLFADLSGRVAEREMRQAGQVGQNLLHSRIGELSGHIKSPVFVDIHASLFEAVLVMNRAHAKHVLVQDQSANKVGMFTQADVCRAVADGVDFKHGTVEAYSNFNLQTIGNNDDVSDALLIMLNHKIHRLPIVEAGKIVGVLGQSELLGFLSHHSELITHRIHQATSVDELAVAVEMIGKFIRTQYRNGTKVYVISRMVQSLNLQVFDKVWQLVAPLELQKNSCVVVMGSEGRGEQIMRTDQDNALIIKDGFVFDNLSHYTKTFNDALNTLGYPNCTGGIMMKNERWCLSLHDFCQQVDAWVAKAGGEEMMWLAVLLDATPVCGDISLLEQLRLHLYRSTCRAQSGFINRFAKPVVEFGDGHSFWQKFTGGADSDIDLKKAGIFPIVHGVRALALEHGISQTATKNRLAALVEKSLIDSDTAQNLMEALAFFLSKRLAVSLEQPDRAARRVNPNTLSALDKDLLKQSLAIVKSFKQFLVRHYRLDMF